MMISKKHVKHLFAPLFCYLFAALVIFRNIIFQYGTIGFFHDWFIGSVPGMVYNYANSGFQLYDLTFGNKIYPSDWMFRLLVLPFSFLGGELVSKGMLVFFCALSGFSMFYLCRTMKLSYLSSFLSGILYLFSPIIFTRAIAGHIYYLLGYALTPFLIASFMKAQKDVKHRLTFSIISGLIFAFIGTQIQFFVMAFLILLALTLIDYQNVKSNLIILALIVFIGSLLHLPWILPLLLTNSSASFSTQSFLSYHEITSSPTLLESLRVIGYNIQPYSFTRLVMQGIIPQWILYTSFLMPIIAFLSLLLKKNKYTVTFSLIALIGIFISKGTNPPFENIFILAFQYTPLVIFRELWHIAFLVFFSYTILVSMFFDKITTNFFNKVTPKISKKVNQIKCCAIAIVLLIIVSNGYPLLLGNMAEYMQTYSFDNDYNDLFQNLQNDENEYRILWLPAITPMKYDNASLSGVDPLISYSPKPTLPQHINSQYPLSKLVMFLTSTINENKTQQFGNLLSPYAIKYMISRTDFESQYPYYTPLGLYPELTERWTMEVTQDFLATQNDLIFENETENFKLYQNPESAEFIYAPTTIVYGTKDLSTLNQLSKLTNLTDVAYLTDISQLETANPIFVTNNGLDLIPIITGTKIDPGNYATETDAQKGWVNSKNWFWYNYLFASSINNGAFSKTKSQLDIPIETDDISEIWAKLLKCPNGATITVKLNNKNETTINTISTASTLEWIKIYDDIPAQSGTLTFSNTDGENYIDEILIINKQQTEQVDPTLQNSTIIYLINPTSMEPTNYVASAPYEESTPIISTVPQFWSDPAIGFSAVVDDQTLGEKSLRVTTDITSTSWSWITSSEIPVRSDSSYLVTSDLKQENAKATHIVVEGFNETSGVWIQLVQVPAGQDGSFDWKTFRAFLDVNEPISKLRVSLNAGWVLDETAGNATSWFGKISITPYKDSNELVLNSNNGATKNLTILKEGNYKLTAEILGNIQLTISNKTFCINSSKPKLIDIGSVFLSEGTHRLEIEALNESQLSGIWIYTSPQESLLEDIFKSNITKTNILEYKQENSASWQIKVNASSPFLLVFAAPYDNNWIARISNRTYAPIPTQGYINGFYINQTGLLEITIEYEPQKWFYYGSIISVTTLIACGIYISYDYTKDRLMWKQIKISIRRIRQNLAFNKQINKG